MTPSLRIYALLAVYLVVGFASPGKAQQPAEPSSTTNGLVEVEAIDIAILNKRLKNEAGLSVEQRQQWLENHVRAILQSETGTASVNGQLIGIAFDQVDRKNAEVRLDNASRGVKVVDDQLLVVASHSEVEKVKALIETFTRFGVRQIVIRTHVLRDTAEAMKSYPIKWSHVEAASRIAESSIAAAVQPASYEKSKPQTAVTRFVESQKPESYEDLPPPAGVTTATWTEATSIVERATPVLYTLLTATEFKEVLAHAKKQPAMQRVMTPSVVVFNGQIATISNCVERPFVTGVRAMKLGEEGKERFEFAPNVKVFQEGTTMKIRPELFDGTSVRLNCQLDLCKIRSVETLEIQGVGRGDYKVQMPEVASTQFRTCLNMPIDYTLAVSSFETDAAGVKHSVVILCQCSLLDIETAPTPKEMSPR